MSPLKKLTLPLAMALCVHVSPAAAWDGECEPAQIEQVINNSPLCAGDTLWMSVDTEGDVAGFFWQGPNTPKFFTLEPWFFFLAPDLGIYQVVAYGPCGTDTATVMVTAQGAGAGQDSTLHLCSSAPPRDLGGALGFHAEGGTWTHDGSPHSGVYVPGMDTPGVYLYTAPFPATCPGSSPCASITVEETFLGAGGSLSICEGDSALSLLLALDSGVAPGGSWYRISFLGFVLHNGIYDPTVDSTGTFRYELNGCQAFVTVIEDSLSAWFMDPDSDGYGDPATLVLSCEKPLGMVADSTDNCSLLPGRIGDPCDDGLPATVNDVITDSCTCAGLLPTAVADSAHHGSPLRVWPNPSTGSPLYLQAEVTGLAQLKVLDQSARLMCVVPLVLGHGPERIDLPVPLAPGLYTLQLISGESLAVTRLLVQ
ncbi:MAG: T9SS type A sorting domain-containing protein [Flavobacteriales bacterium]|nr:T9SS type A sorting domain-containing protein [Flavobacteriales bacterium]MBP9079531.1 T9SS type A sorting domain-containing protein [Flavobacteriales bacterium]